MLRCSCTGGRIRAQMAEWSESPKKEGAAPGLPGRLSLFPLPFAHLPSPITHPPTCPILPLHPRSSTPSVWPAHSRATASSSTSSTAAHHSRSLLPQLCFDSIPKKTIFNHFTNFIAALHHRSSSARPSGIRAAIRPFAPPPDHLRPTSSCLTSI